MFTTLVTVDEFKSIFAEMLFNKTSKVTKASNGSVVNAIAFGNAKTGQKIVKDIAALEARIFPDFSYGKYLDDISRLWGVSNRFGAKQSSTYVRVSGAPGTTYQTDLNVFKSIDGTQFTIESNYTIGVFGWGYVKVRSVKSGVSANVDAFSITSVSPIPFGHQYCINEYAAQYALDVENDDVFRLRIKEGCNVLSRPTISSIEQVLMKINENVLRAYYSGINNESGVMLSVLSENGIDFTEEEFSEMILRAQKFLSMTELTISGLTNNINFSLKNVTWFPVDISFRCDLNVAYDADEIRKSIQIIIGKYIDYRYWDADTKIEWDNLLEIVKRVPGVSYVPDQYFYPSSDLKVPKGKMPRIRGFQMLDMTGNVIQDFQLNLNPIFFPNQADFSFQTTVLSQI